MGQLHNRYDDHSRTHHGKPDSRPLLPGAERTELTLANTSAKAAFGSVFNFIFTVTVDVLGLELEDI